VKPVSSGRGGSPRGRSQRASLRARKDQGENPLPVMAIERSRSGEIPGPRKNAYFARQGIGFQALGEESWGN
jgi:hypothetical protein